MRFTRFYARVGGGATIVAMLTLVGVAGAQTVPQRASSQAADARPASEDTMPGRQAMQHGMAMQHGEEEGHLPASSANVSLIGKLEPTEEFGPIAEGQIADLAVHRGFAYLNSWNEPTCTKGGVYVIDIRNPREPEEIGFIPAVPGNFHGEGAQVMRSFTRSFTGRLLAVNNEKCSDTEAGGGFDLYDVTDPFNPKTLVQGFGDTGPEGDLTGDEIPNTYHSVFMWRDDGKNYLVATDNEEFTDVDIYNISNPRRPKPVAEYDLWAEFPQIAQVDEHPRLSQIFNHDMVVKVVGGRNVLFDAYWDAGYVMVDVENPRRASYIGDTDFENEDPLVPGISPPEGNAHQVEPSHNNRFFLGADEDFNPYRLDELFIDDQLRPGTEVGGGLSPAALEDQVLSGKVVYGGYGCPLDPTPLPQADDYTAEELGLQPGDEKILLMQRGPVDDPGEDYNNNGDLTDDACFPGEKAARAAEAGWDAIVLVNRHLGADDTASEPFCGSGAFTGPMVTVCTTHAAMHELFGSTPNFDLPVPDGDAPALGAISTKRVRATSIFDGWGYVSLFRRSAGKVERVDSYAIPEALDEDFAFGFGDLSVHEIAMNPNRNLAYSSYYAGGARVFRFGDFGIEEVGHFIDEGGNNFWGVQTFVPRSRAAGNLQGKRLFAESDRDFGLYIFRYTGSR